MAGSVACTAPAADDEGSRTTTSAGDDFGPGSGGAEDTNFGMDDDMPLAAFVSDIKRGSWDEGSFVSLRGIIVTSPAMDWGARPAQFVRDPGQSSYAGLRLDLVSRAVIQMGELPEVVGYVARDDDGYYLREAAARAGGVRAVPEPITVDARELLPEGERRESLADMVVVFAELDGEPMRVIEDDIGRARFSVAPGLVVDLSAFVEGGEAPAVGTPIDKVTGVLVLEGSGARVLPRSAEELVAG